MKIEIEVSDDELREYIMTAAGRAPLADWSVDRNLYKRTVADCVWQVIYKIVAQASRECGNKAAQKIVREAMKND